MFTLNEMRLIRDLLNDWTGGFGESHDQETYNSTMDKLDREIRAGQRFISKYRCYCLEQAHFMCLVCKDFFCGPCMRLHFELKPTNFSTIVGRLTLEQPNYPVILVVR